MTRPRRPVTKPVSARSPRPRASCRNTSCRKPISTSSDDLRNSDREKTKRRIGPSPIRRASQVNSWKLFLRGVGGAGRAPVRLERFLLVAIAVLDDFRGPARIPFDDSGAPFLGPGPGHLFRVGGGRLAVGPERDVERLAVGVLDRPGAFERARGERGEGGRAGRSGRRETRFELVCLMPWNNSFDFRGFASNSA